MPNKTMVVVVEGSQASKQAMNTVSVPLKFKGQIAQEHYDCLEIGESETTTTKGHTHIESIVATAE